MTLTLVPTAAAADDGGVGLLSLGEVVVQRSVAGWLALGRRGGRLLGVHAVVLGGGAVASLPFSLVRGRFRHGDGDGLLRRRRRRNDGLLRGWDDLDHFFLGV